jgi:hypothetical protein
MVMDIYGRHGSGKYHPKNGYNKKTKNPISEKRIKNEKNKS